MAGCAMYILSIIFPPAVPLLLGFGWKHTLLNVCLLGFMWVPATVHAACCVWAWDNYFRHQQREPYADEQSYNVFYQVYDHEIRR